MSNLLLYLDVETTDKNTKTAGITQLSAIIVRDGVEASRINLDVNALSYNKAISVSKKALEITGKSLIKIKSYPAATISFIKFTSWLNAHRDIGEYYTLIAYRTQFDLEMLQEFFKDQTSNASKLYDYIHFKHLDVLQLVLFLDLYTGTHTKNHKLETMCNHYGIKIKAHDSMSDIESTRKLHKKLMADLGFSFSKINKV